MDVGIFDSHSHLDAPEFDADRDAVVSRAHAAGVSRQLVPAIDQASWPKLKQVCASAPGLHADYGLHPMLVDRHRPEHIDDLSQWLAREKPCAIGECGLDFFIEGLDAEQQRLYFRAQLRLAREFNLPVVVHARRALEEVTLTLRRTGGLRGVVHSFSGSAEQARQLFDLGFLLGIGGPITYDRARRLRAVVATMPGEFLLVETDSPDQPNSGDRGGRNEPARIRSVVEVVSSLRGESFEAIAAQTHQNAMRLFSLC